MRSRRAVTVPDGQRLYKLSATVTVSIYTEVVASSFTEAIDEAASRSIQGLCHQCSGGDKSSEWSLTGELDGVATDIRVDD